MPPSWRLYYVDGSTFDSDAGGPRSTPDRGVACLLVNEIHEGSPRNRIIRWRDNYYFEVVEMRWEGGDFYGVRDRLREGTQLLINREGRVIPREALNTIMAAALTDPDFPDQVE